MVKRAAMITAVMNSDDDDGDDDDDWSGQNEWTGSHMTNLGGLW